MSETALDLTHAAMQAAPEDEAARLRFFHALADCELFLLLAKEADGAEVEPEVFEIEAQSYVLVFDREARLAEFVGRAAPYAALSGRALVGMLKGQDIGLAVNPEVAPSSILLPEEAVDWLADTLVSAPKAVPGCPGQRLCRAGAAGAGAGGGGAAIDADGRAGGGRRDRRGPVRGWARGAYSGIL